MSSAVVMRMRRGISFTMTMIVTAVVLLGAAFLIMSIGQSSFSDISSFFSTSSGQSEAELLRQECMAEKNRLCRRNGVQYAANDNLDGWADNAGVDGTTCKDLATTDNIFGPQGASSIPQCDNSKTQLASQCISAREDFCQDKDSSTAWTDNVADSNIPANCLDIQNELAANGVSITC